MFMDVEDMSQTMKNITIPNETYGKLQETKKKTGFKRYSQVIKHLIATSVD